MKNIHVLPTIPNDETAKGIWIKETRDWCNIYITNDEEIKEGDWYITPNNTVLKALGEMLINVEDYKKIILTTDLDLIKYGVQAIPDEFLEWFVKNPSCENIKTYYVPKNIFRDEDGWEYNLEIPKEEPKQDLEKEIFELEQELDIPSHLRWHNSKPKQETIEEAAFNFTAGKSVKEIYSRMDFIKGATFGAKWQSERMYNEQTVTEYAYYFESCYAQKPMKTPLKPSEWFEQFKKK